MPRVLHSIQWSRLAAAAAGPRNVLGILTLLSFIQQTQSKRGGDPFPWSLNSVNRESRGLGLGAIRASSEHNNPE